MKKQNSLAMKTNPGDDHNVSRRSGYVMEIQIACESILFNFNIDLVEIKSDLQQFSYNFKFSFLFDLPNDLCSDGADENVTLHHCATPQPCGEDMFTCENGRCINKVRFEWHFE